MIVYFDYESKAGPGAPDLRRAGAYRYAAHADAIVLAYAIDDGPVKVIATGQPLTWADLPELHEPFASGATFVAWNASFDRAIWNYALIDSPFLRPEQVHDAMAAALAANLPPDLERASTLLTGRGKLTDGKRLIGLFCNADSPLIDTESEDWKKFLAYASIDVVRLREVCKIMRPLPAAEWHVYAASEAINDRGIPVDLLFAEKAAALAAQDVVRTNARLTEITNGEITSVYQHERIASWAYNRLGDAEARAILVSYVPDPEENESEIDEEETPPVPVLSCKRPNIVRLQDWLEKHGMPDPVLYEVLSLREFGAGASPKKFAAMMDQQIEGRLHGQIVFNGAGQTGRFCLAEGSRVLVRHDGVVSEKPIERVSANDEVWDGEEWVTHDGVVFSGEKEVIEHDGVLATPEHNVYLSTNYRISLGEAKALAAPLWRGEIDVSDLQTNGSIRPFLRRHHVDEDV